MVSSSGAQQRCTHNVKTIRRVAKPGSGLATFTQSFTYESSFNKVATSTDGRGKVTSYSYTAQGLPLAVTSPADAAGVQPVTTFGYTAYNAANKYVPQTVVADAGTGKLNLSTTLTFDAVGNPTQVNGPRTDVTDTVTTAYDGERRPTQVTDALGKLTRLAYDADGRLIRSAAQIGAQWLVSCRSYTASGKLLKAWGPAQTTADTSCPAAAAPVPVTDYAYDDLDRPSRVTQNLTAGEGGNRVTDTVYTSTAIYSYGPYGEPNITSGQRFRYTGQQLIGGLDIYYYKARVYVAHCQGRPRGVCASWRRPLEDFVHRFIAEMIKAGAAPVIGDITAPFGWSPVLKYGEDPTKVADALVSEWLASKSDPDVDGIWFAFQAVWK